MIIAPADHAAMAVLVVTSAAVVLALPSLAVILIRGRLVAGIRNVGVLGVLTVLGLVAATVVGNAFSLHLRALRCTGPGCRCIGCSETPTRHRLLRALNENISSRHAASWAR